MYNRTVWNRSAIAALALVAAIALSACSSTGSSSDGTTADDVDADATESAAASTVLEPSEAGLDYRCDAVQFSASDLASASEPVAVGDATIDPVPLDAVLPALMVSQGDEPALPCVAVRVGVLNLRPVAWELSDGDVTIESCLDPAGIETDLRTVGDINVLTVYGPYPEAEADCSVNGSVVLDLEVPADVLDGLIFPFQIPSATLAERMGFSQGATALPLDATLLSCQATTLPGEANITWSGVEVGLAATVLAGAADLGDDAAIFHNEIAGIDGSPSIFAAANERRAEAGDAPLTEILNQGFSDYQAPGEGVRPYRLEVADHAGTVIGIDCGAAGQSDAGFAAGEPVVAGSLDESAELFSSVAALPYVYMRVVPTCPGCSGDEVELMLTPVDGVRVFEPPLAQQTDPNQPGLVDPFALHQLLADAEAEGKDVSYVIDPGSGTPIEWSIDGEGARILCLETDTAPPDLRTAPGCTEAGSVLGG